MTAFLGMLRERYGGAAEYAKSKCSLTDEDVYRIKANLVMVAEPGV